MSERYFHPEIPSDLITAYAQTFILRRDCYPLQHENGYVCVKRPLTDALIRAHLKGQITIGAYALNSESLGKWLCFDADEEEAFQALLQMVTALTQKGVPSYLEASRRGGHLWLFTTPLHGSDIRQFAFALLNRFQIDQPLEVYPKQSVLKTGVGSLVRLPLGIHRKTGQRYGFITPEGQPLAANIRRQIALLASPERIPPDYIQQVLSESQLAPPPTHMLHPSLSPNRQAVGETLSAKLKAAISVFEFVRQFVELDAYGKGLCPFHDDEHQSFQVNASENYWSCYAGCGGGSLIDFWMKWREKLGKDNSFGAAVTELRQMLL